MEKYHKIHSLFHRDPDTKFKTFLMGQYSRPEFSLLEVCRWQWTEKIDGTNIRVDWDGERVALGGRTDHAQIPASLVAILQTMFPPRAFADADMGPMTLFGEGFGARIQKGGGLYSDTQDFILFDVNCGGLWLTRESVLDIVTRLCCKMVPVVGEGTLAEAVAFASSGFDSHIAKSVKAAEGIVLRPACELLDRRGERIITKLKTKDFQQG